MSKPAIDLYGPYARASALADVLEAKAVRGALVTMEGLADYMRDAGWTRRKGLDLFELPSDADDSAVADEFGDDLNDEDLGDAVDDARREAELVLDLLAERAALLGSRYPFVLKERNVLRYAGPANHDSFYLGILGLTLSHANGLPHHGSPPSQVIEDVVRDHMRSRGFLAENIGRIRRGHGTFGAALEATCAPLLLKATPSRAAYRTKAMEEGVDVIAHAPYSNADDRPGRWVWVGQVTCGRSDSWRDKMQEPSPPRWMRLLGLSVQPQPFFAVPHHVPRNMLAYLAGQTERCLFIDRLRLAASDLPVTSDLRAFAQVPSSHGGWLD